MANIFCWGPIIPIWDGCCNLRTLDFKPPNLWLPHWNTNDLALRACNLECKHYVKAEKKESIIDIRLTQIDADEDTILTKIIAAKKEDKGPTRNEISAKGWSYWVQWVSLKVIDGCLFCHWDSADGKTSSKLIVVPSCKMKEVLKEFHKNVRISHLGLTKTLERRFYWVGCQQWQKIAKWCRV